MENIKSSKIIRISIGKNFTGEWSINGDDKALLITRNSIQTKLKLAKPFVSEHGKDALNELINSAVIGITDDDNSVYFISSDFLPFDTSISKENYNVLLRKKKDDEEINSLLILDLSNDVKLLRYMCEHEIINSYHSSRTENPSYGCFIKIPSELESDVEICRLQTFEGDKYYQYIITTDDIKKYEIKKPALLSSLDKTKSSLEKTNKPVGFRVTPKVFPTRIVIAPLPDEGTNEDAIASIEKFINDKFPDTKKEKITLVLAPNVDNDPEKAQDLIDDLKDIFVNPEYTNGVNIKAVTLYDYKLNYNVSKELKLNYIFSLDTTGNLKTLKSN